MIEQLQEIQREKEKKTVATNNNNDKSPAKDRVWFQIYAHTHKKIWRDSESEIMKWMHRTKQLGKITNHIQKKDEEKDLQQRQNAIESESKQTGKEWDGRSTCKN